MTVGARYSIISNSWIVAPQECSDAGEISSLAEKKADNIRRTIDAAIELDDQERLEQLMDRLRAFRTFGLEDDGGVCSVENEAYKILRRTGVLNRLKQAALREYDEALSYSESCSCGPKKYSKSDWVPYNGPAGGKGWQHVSSGRIEYGDEPPGEDQEPDMGDDPEHPDDSPSPWDTPAAAPAMPQPIATGPVPDPSQLTPAERAVQPDHVQAAWHARSGAGGEQLWQHPQTGETVLSKEAPNAQKAADIAAQARAGGAAKKPTPQPAAEPAAQPVAQPAAAPAPAQSAPQPAAPPKKGLNNLKRAWHSGQSTGTVQFEDEDHRDFFDLASKSHRAMTASGKVGQPQQAQLHKEAQFLQKSLAQRTGMSPQEVMAHAIDVNKSSREQAKGLGDGEHRQLKFERPKSGQQQTPAPQPATQQQQTPTNTPETPVASPQAATPPQQQAGGGQTKDHPAAPKVNAMPDGTTLFGYTKETPKGLGMSVWTNGDDALGTNQLLQEHNQPEHQTELDQKLNAPPDPAQAASQGGGQQQQHREYTSEESGHVHSASAIFGIAPGDLGNQRAMEGFILRTARNTGFNPSSVAGDRTDKTVAAAKHLAAHRPHLQALVSMAKGYGWGGGTGRELAHSARHAGLHLVKTAAQRGYDPEGNTEAEHVAGAINFLKDHEQKTTAAQHSSQQAVTAGLHSLWGHVKQAAGDYSSGRRKITAMDIALAAIGFYVGYRMVKKLRRRRGRR